MELLRSIGSDGTRRLSVSTRE